MSLRFFVAYSLCQSEYNLGLYNDDLNVFPLGKRELPGEHLDRLEPATEPMAKTFRESLRFPIYVHSKMMIVDDVYIIVGSANINQVSDVTLLAEKNDRML